MTDEPTLFDVADAPEVVPEPQVRVRLTVAYDGSAFHGFADNPGVRTVGGSLHAALERILRHPVELTCAGRTDRGVHAHGQVVDFATTDGVDLDALVRAANSLCGPEIAVREPTLVPLDWSARFDARWRRYRYTIRTGATPDPFSVGTAWHVKEDLDLARLRLAVDPLLGTHDFSSFCRRATAADGSDKSLVRDVLDARWVRRQPEVLELWLTATSFCHQMVRAITGTLVEVGRGRRSPGDVAAILAACDRAAAGPVAPPDGLTLWQVGYTTELPPVP